MERQEVIEKFKKIPFKEWELDDLNTFFDTKEAYLKNRSTSALSDMKMAYSPVYYAIKHAWMRGEITKENFEELVDLVQEGLD